MAPIALTPIENVLLADLQGYLEHQRTHDTKKDRYFQSLGIPICRFTGHQIWQRPHELAQQAWDFCRLNFVEKGYVQTILDCPEDADDVLSTISRLRESVATFVLSERSIIESSPYLVQ